MIEFAAKPVLFVSHVPNDAIITTAPDSENYALTRANAIFQVNAYSSVRPRAL